MTYVKFRDKPVTSPLGIVAAVMFVIVGMSACILAQPFFWVFGRRGPIRRLPSGGLEFNTHGSFQRRSSAI